MFRRSTVSACRGKKGAMITSGQKPWVSDKCPPQDVWSLQTSCGNIWEGPEVEPLSLEFTEARWCRHLDRRPPRCMSRAIFLGCSTQRRPQGRHAGVSTFPSWLRVPQELDEATRRREFGTSTVSTRTDVGFHLKLSSHTCTSQHTVRKDAFNVQANLLSASFCETWPAIPQNQNKMSLQYIF